MRTSAALLSMLLAVGTAASAAQTIDWPADLPSSLEGKWVNERDATAIEIVKGDIFLKHQSQFSDLAAHQAAIGAKVGQLGVHDASRDSENHHLFKGRCWTWSMTSPYFYDCGIDVNKYFEAGKQQTILAFNGGLFHRESELSDWGKKHRLRAHPDD